MRQLNLVFAILTVALPLLAGEAPAATTPAPREVALSRAPYIQLATPTTMNIVWRTFGGSAPAVRFGKSAAALDQHVTGPAITIRTAAHLQNTLPKLHSAPEWTWQYEARLSGLSPETKYYYAVYAGDKKLAGGDEQHYFVTHPPAGKDKPVRMWVVGDSGTGLPVQAAVHTAMRALITEQRRPLDMYLHVGDMAYGKGKDDEFQRFFFKMYEETLRNVVCWPSMGNHEGATSRGATGTGPYYDAYVVPTKAEAGGLASGTEAYYSFDFGQIHFICLNSHDLDRKPEGAMAKWLKADIEQTQAAWLIAFWHHPPYTKGSHDSDVENQLKEMREHIMPILESGGVDIVLTGHSHIYERSMLMDGAYATPTVAENVILDDGDGDPAGDGAYRKSAGLHPNEGTVQVVTGHGGTKNSRKGTMPVMKRITIEHGSCIIDIDGKTLNAIMLNFEGKQRDRFSIVKDGKVTVKRIANPKQLPPYTPPAREKKDAKEKEDDK